MGIDKDLITELTKKHETPLLLVDCAQLETQVASLRQALPDVDLFYAIKAFPDAIIIQQLDALGVGFDLASSGEIELVRQHHINPRNTIHTHPVKKHSDIRHALRFGCTTFVVDNEEEIKKFSTYRHRVGLLLRISFRNPDAAIDLSKKFGCDLEQVEKLLKVSTDHGIRIKGFSFHVGSQCKTSATHVQAIEQCVSLFNHLQHQYPSLSALDIGGGFPVNYAANHQVDKPGEYDIDIIKFCDPIRTALQTLPENIRVLAEPGRFLVAPIAISISRVIGKNQRNGKTWYYLDDGIYGNYSGQIFDGMHYPIETLKQGSLQPCVLAGPTCDSIDVIAEDILLPALDVGDIVIGKMMGAYTHTTATRFNSLAPAKIIHLNNNILEQKIIYIA